MEATRTLSEFLAKIPQESLLYKILYNYKIALYTAFQQTLLEHPDAYQKVKTDSSMDREGEETPWKEIDSQSFYRKQASTVFNVLENLFDKRNKWSLMDIDINSPEDMNQLYDMVNKQRCLVQGHKKNIEKGSLKTIFPYYQHYYTKNARLYCDALKIPFRGGFSYGTVKMLRNWYLIDQYVKKYQLSKQEDINLYSLNHEVQEKKTNIVLTNDDLASYFEGYGHLEEQFDKIKDFIQSSKDKDLNTLMNSPFICQKKGINPFVMKLYSENYTNEAIWKYKSSLMKDLWQEMKEYGYGKENFKNYPWYSSFFSWDETPYTEEDFVKFVEGEEDLTDEEKQEVFEKVVAANLNSTWLSQLEIIDYRNQKEAEKQAKAKTEEQKRNQKKQVIKEWLSGNEVNLQDLLVVWTAYRRDWKGVLNIPHAITYEDFQRYQRECPQESFNTLQESFVVPSIWWEEDSLEKDDALGNESFFRYIAQKELRCISDLKSLSKSTKKWTSTDWQALKEKFDDFTNDADILNQKLIKTQNKDLERCSDYIFPLTWKIALFVDQKDGKYIVVWITDQYTK